MTIQWNKTIKKSKDREKAEEGEQYEKDSNKNDSDDNSSDDAEQCLKHLCGRIT